MKAPCKPYVPKYANYDYLPVWQGNFIVDWIKVYYTIEKKEREDVREEQEEEYA